MSVLPRFARSALGVALVGVLSGCASARPSGMGDGPGWLPVRAEVRGVPFFAQDQYSCGPAALAMAFAWSGLDVTPQTLVEHVYTEGRDGSLPVDLLTAARRWGRVAVPVSTEAQLFRELSAGHPVIVLQNLGLRWVPQWHFAVVIGYDHQSGEIVLHSGAHQDRRLSLQTFATTWARGGRWGLVVLPPDRLPATADEAAVVRAAAGLERTRRFVEAEAAYAAVVARWPTSYAGLMGLGNARYALGDYTGAESAFRTAITERPDAPAGWNNLAHALAKQRRVALAVEAARQAFRLAGEDNATYAETLREVASE
jgi:hypothetical protein